MTPVTNLFIHTSLDDAMMTTKVETLVTTLAKSQIGEGLCVSAQMLDSVQNHSQSTGNHYLHNHLLTMLHIARSKSSHESFGIELHKQNGISRSADRVCAIACPRITSSIFVAIHISVGEARELQQEGSVEWLQQ